MPLQKPLIDRIRGARTDDRACPYVEDDMTPDETAAVAYWWRASLDAAAQMHADAERIAGQLILGAEHPGHPGADTDTRLNSCTNQLRTWLSDYHSRRSRVQ